MKKYVYEIFNLSFTKIRFNLSESFEVFPCYFPFFSEKNSSLSWTQVM